MIHKYNCNALTGKCYAKVNYFLLFSEFIGCGITIDSETSILSRIMIFSVIPFLIMQIANIFHSSSAEKISILIALGVSTIFLLLYFIYQVHTFMINCQFMNSLYKLMSMKY